MHQNYKINLSPSQYHDAMKKLTFYKTTRRSLFLAINTILCIGSFKSS